MIQLPGDDVQRAERGDRVGDRLSDDHVRVGLEDRKTGWPDSNPVGVFRSVRDDVEAKLPIGSLDSEVDLADRRLFQAKQEGRNKDVGTPGSGRLRPSGSDIRPGE